MELDIYARSYIQFFLRTASVSASTPFDLNPSTTPWIALPCSVSTKITSIGLAVAQYMLTISGTSFGYASAAAPALERGYTGQGRVIRKQKIPSRFDWGIGAGGIEISRSWFCSRQKLIKGHQNKAFLCHLHPHIHFLLLQILAYKFPIGV
jgi:hypothetical protein